MYGFLVIEVNNKGNNREICYGNYISDVNAQWKPLADMRYMGKTC